MQIDSMRFVFKSSVLLQKTQISLNEFLQQKNPEDLYDALDNLDAAYGFLNTEYLQHNEDILNIQQNLQRLSVQLEVSLTKPAALKPASLHQELDTLSSELNHVSESIWLSFEKNFFALQVNEAKLIKQYEFIILLILFVVGVLGWFAKQQHQLYGNLQEQKKQLQELAYYDTLTKIPNRKSIEHIISDRIESAKRNDEEFYVALIDLDDFKKVNDIFGHAAGDQLLIQSVQRIKECVRVNDVLGRFGGDEFILVFESSLHVNEIEMVLERINKAFANSIVIDTTLHSTNASIGVVSYPQTATSTSELIKLADIAMYQAKSLGKGRYLFFEDHFSSALEYQYKIEPEIKNALHNGEFELYYQPQYAAKNLNMVSAEALIRWNHPQKGLITPDHFIPIIENGFMVKEFGEWVITQAAKQQKLWKNEGIDIAINVNLSVKHIMLASFYDDMTSLITKLDIDLSRFSFEITEYKLMRYQEQSMQTLNKLVALGFGFKLDDFGTGYSSITHLNQMRFKAIKIDKEFIDPITNPLQKAPLIDAIINMAKSLELCIVAEGVETKAQLEYLRSKGCDLMQGYYFSKPLSVQTFAANFKELQNFTGK